MIKKLMARYDIRVYEVVILLLLIAYQCNDSYADYKVTQRKVKTAAAEKVLRDSKLLDLTTKDFISILKLSNIYTDTIIYLKVDTIKGDEITVTPMEMKNHYPKAWEVEEEYNRRAKTLPSVKISHKQLLASYVKYSYSSDTKELEQHGVNLLHDGRSYVTIEVVRHFGPSISSSGTGSLDGFQLTIGFNNVGWPATIIDIKELTGNGDWSGNINAEVPARESFRLHVINHSSWKPYKILMTLKDSTGQLHKYEIAGVYMDNTVKEL